MKSLILNQINHVKFKGKDYQIIPLNLQHGLIFMENQLIASYNMAVGIVHYYSDEKNNFLKSLPPIKGFEIEIRSPELCLYYWDYFKYGYVPMGSMVGSPTIRKNLLDQIRRGEFNKEYLTEEEEKEFERLKEAGDIEKIDLVDDLPVWRITDSGWDTIDELVYEQKSNV